MKKLMILFIFLSVALTAATQVKQASSSDMLTLISLTQQLREKSEIYLMNLEAGAPADKQHLDALYERQQSQLAVLEQDPKLAPEMARLKRYTHALYAELPDLDAYMVFQAYSLLIHRMIDDTAQCAPCSDLPEADLLAIEEDLEELKALSICEQALTYDKSAYNALFSLAYGDLSDRLIVLRKTQRIRPLPALHPIIEKTALFLTQIDRQLSHDTVRDVLSRSAGTAAAIADDIRALLKSPAQKSASAMHYSLR